MYCPLSPKNRSSRFLIGATLLVSSCAYAAHSYVWDTGAGGVGNTTFASGGSWTGDGTVLVRASPGLPGGSFTGLVNNFTSGALLLTDVDYASGVPTPSNFTVTHNVMVTGGTADLRARHTGGAAAKNNGFFLRLDEDVTSVMWETTYSDPIHSRQSNSHRSFFPWLGSIEVDPGTDITTMISGIQTVTGGAGGSTTGATVTPGLTGAPSIVFGGSNVNNPPYAVVGNTLVATQTNINDTDANHINTVTVPDPGNVHPGGGVNGWTTAALTNNIIQDGERVLADTIKWTITPNGGGTFATGTQWTLTFDGFLGQDTVDAIGIPEPSRAMLLLLAVMACAGRRRR